MVAISAMLTVSYFMYSIPDAYSFFRVQFFSTQQGRERDFVTIWISLKTLLPIGITSNNELFAVLPESSLFPAVRKLLHIHAYGIYR